MAGGDLENHVKKYGNKERAERVLSARSKANLLGENHPDHPKALVNYYRTKAEALEEVIAQHAADMAHAASTFKQASEKLD